MEQEDIKSGEKGKKKKKGGGEREKTRYREGVLKRKKARGG